MRLFKALICASLLLVLFPSCNDADLEEINSAKTSVNGNFSQDFVPVSTNTTCYDENGNITFDCDEGGGTQPGPGNPNTPPGTDPCIPIYGVPCGPGGSPPRDDMYDPCDDPYFTFECDD